jgi:hypothetical protein
MQTEPASGQPFVAQDVGRQAPPAQDQPSTQEVPMQAAAMHIPSLQTAPSAQVTPSQFRG